MIENTPPVNEKELAYDLRQVWVKLVGEQLEDVKEAKKSDKPINYYKELEDLFDLVQQKFSDKAKTIPEFNKIRTEIISMAHANINVWIGANQNSEIYAKIEGKLREMERKLYDCMEEANMYGAKFDDEGL